MKKLINTSINWQIVKAKQKVNSDNSKGTSLTSSVVNQESTNGSCNKIKLIMNSESMTNSM